MKRVILSLPTIETDDPFETFRAVRGTEKDAFFFETADHFGERAHLSVIGLGPFVNLHGPIFETLKLASKGNPSHSLIPFADGGFFGCIGYDAVTEAEPKLYGVGHFSLSTSDSSRIISTKNLIVFDRRSKLVHFIGERATQHRPSLTKRKIRATPKNPAAESCASRLDEICASRLKPTLGAEKFRAAVKVLKAHIRQGDIFQAVLAERFECTKPKVSSLEIFEALREISPTPYSFFFTFKDRDLFGASPEALLKVKGSGLKTYPIAGTRPRGQTEVEDKALERQLTRSRKEAAEHLMLVDLARNDLGRVAKAGSVKVDVFRSIQKFSNVMHLVSEVNAELAEGSSPVDALQACFPAGTLSGAPKFRAMEILAQLEPLPRGFYGGVVMAFDPASMDLDTCIAIRSLEMTSSRALLRAGAGIVADSVPQAEYEEIHHKLKPLRQAIALAERKSHGSPHR